MPVCRANSIAFVVQGTVASTQYDVTVGERIELPFDSGNRGWESGHLALAERQQKPPFAAVKYASTKLDDKSVIGPECRSTVRLQRVSNELVQGNRLKGLLHGKEIRIFYQALEKFVFMEVTGAQYLEQSIIWQIQRPYGFVLERADFVELSERLPDDEALDEGLVLVRDEGEGPFKHRPRFQYRRVGQDWARYHQCLRDFGRKKDRFLQDCLEEGRVLLFDFFDSGSGLIHPDYWRRAPYSWTSNPNVHFVFSKDLPTQWFNQGTGPRNLKRLTAMKEGRLYLEELYAHRAEDGGVGNKRELLQLLVDSFGLSERAAAQVWQESDIPEWKQPGRKRSLTRR